MAVEQRQTTTTGAKCQPARPGYIRLDVPLMAVTIVASQESRQQSKKQGRLNEQAPTSQPGAGLSNPPDAPYSHLPPSSEQQRSLLARFTSSVASPLLSDTPRSSYPQPALARTAHHLHNDEPQDLSRPGHDGHAARRRHLGDTHQDVQVAHRPHGCHFARCPWGQRSRTGGQGVIVVPRQWSLF